MDYSMALYRLYGLFKKAVKEVDDCADGKKLFSFPTQRYFLHLACRYIKCRYLRLIIR
jgi:hypothetical protein